MVIFLYIYRLNFFFFFTLSILQNLLIEKENDLLLNYGKFAVHSIQYTVYGILYAEYSVYDTVYFIVYIYICIRLVELIS